MSVEVTISATPLQALDAIQAFAEARRGAGALASFVGYCRDEGGAVTTLELQHYPGFTERTIEARARELAERRGLLALLVLHRVGPIAPGAAIVAVAALSSHRAAALAAVEEMMDFLKTDAPFWKLERRADGAEWIEPTEADRERRKRWS
jgi:molybdopterin synthase catalytic subunit